MRPLDIVKSKKGGYGVIVEVSEPHNGLPQQASIDWFIYKGDYSAWWSEEEGIEIVGNIPAILAKAMADPSGAGAENPYKDEK